MVYHVRWSALNRVPEEVTLIGFADKLAVVVVAMDPGDMELYGTETMHVFKSWFTWIQWTKKRKRSLLLIAGKIKLSKSALRDRFRID